MFSHRTEFQAEKDKGQDSVEPPRIAGLRHQLTTLLSSESFEIAHQDDAIALAWSILRESGLPTFGDVRTKRAADLCRIVLPEIREAVSLSLDTVGWLSYAPKPGQFDRAAQMFARAVALCPLVLDRLEKFAIIAGEIRPEHIAHLRHDPQKQAQTSMGYAVQAAKNIEYAFEERFGITRDVLNDASGESLNRLLSSVDDDERQYLARMLRHLAHLHALQAVFFDNGVHAGKAVAAGCSVLQIMGLPSGIFECVGLIEEALPQHHPRELFGEDGPLLISTLDAISRGLYAKWKLFNNSTAGRRSEQLDNLCDTLEAKLAERAGSLL